jgi:ribonuclease R
MLPEVLSNDLCSLNPNVDRFAFGAVFDIEKSTGKILDRWFGKTLINSDKRFSYEEAQEILDTIQNQQQNFDSSSLKGSHGDQNFATGFSIGTTLSELNRLANIYRAENKKNGAIEFETDEVKFELDETGKPIRIYKKSRLDTMKMIEEWMLLANREVAKFLSDKIKQKGVGASIFRIHNLPKMERIEELAVFVRALGHELPIKNGEVSAKDINLLLQKIEGHAAESLIKTATVRSMAKAIYSTKNIGHFGLAFEYYTHFTSPIRRYPDLLVHRILFNHLTNAKISRDEMSKFEKIAEEASEKEITVAEAERESIRYKQVEFMQDKVGVEFQGVVSGVTEWGMYIEDPETKVEGMVKLKEMTDDIYELDQKNYCIIGTRTKKKYSLGGSVRVKLLAANLDRKTLDFKLA